VFFEIRRVLHFVGDEVSASSDPIPSATQRRATSPLGFWCAIVAAALSIAAFVVWPMVDASYVYGRYIAQVDLGLKTVNSAAAAEAIGLTRTIVDIANGWDALGPRIILFLSLCAMGIVATAWSAIACVRSSSVRRLVAVVAVCCAWVALIACDTSIQRWSVRRHATGLLSKVETAAVALQSHWPAPTNHSSTKIAAVVPDLEVVVSDGLPNTLVVTGRKSYPIREDFGMLIDRSDDGAIRFALSGAAGWNLEWHPAGSEPKTYLDGFGNESAPIAEWTRLKEHWYLVRYKDS
jgi:hypothetical protein